MRHRCDTRIGPTFAVALMLLTIGNDCRIPGGTRFDIRGDAAMVGNG